MLVFLAAGGGVAEGQYLAVFVDGRILAVTGARAIDGSRFHLDLPGGGSLEVPLARIDRVIADDVEPEPEPIPPAVCGPDWVDQALGPGVPFARELGQAARAARLHPLLVVAVVKAESDFKPWAVSKVGACGLMQLMPSVWLEQGLTDPFEPGANLRAGCRHLRALLDQFKDVPTALAAYNAGVATVQKSGGIPPYRETREFVRRVLGRFCPVSGSKAEGGAD
ncbi:MAG: lytic transglycosylase domain-containing protein [Acidobacteriia bacterium]|nr:lytic transglycosylase domain-containing protein [Terriglobia bacterium]